MNSLWRYHSDSRPNIVPMLAALGRFDRWFTLRGVSHSQTMLKNLGSAVNVSGESKSAVHMYRLDDLFDRFWTGEQPAMECIDKSET